MKKTGIILLLFILIISCKENKESESTTTDKSTVIKEKRNLVGGWSAIEVSENVQDLAKYVLSENNIDSPINAITNAASQVVSGKNYRFNMSLNNGENYLVQVYVNIQDEKLITNFKKID